MKEYVRILRLFALFGQLGFTIVTPPVVLAILAHWLQSRFSLGGWVMLIAIVLGLLASASGAYRFYRRVCAESEKDQKDTVVFYKHE